MIQRATVVLSLLLTACVPLPTLTRAPDGILHDELFAAPAEPVDTRQVFALSDAMKAYLRDELASQVKASSSSNTTASRRAMPLKRSKRRRATACHWLS